MADTYKGESLSKKVARAWFWFGAMRWLGRERFVAGKHLILASREGGDAAVLKALGVPARNIVAMELNGDAAVEFKEKHPDVPFFVGDVARLVNDKKFRGQLLTAHLDFCGWATDAIIQSAVRVARFGIKHDGLLSLGVLKGRDQAGYLREEIDKQRAMMKSVLQSEKTAVRDLLTKEIGTTMYSDAVGQVVWERFWEPGPPCVAEPFWHVAYDSGASPMLYNVFSVLRAPSDGILRRDRERFVTMLRGQQWDEMKKFVGQRRTRSRADKTYARTIAQMIRLHALQSEVNLGSDRLWKRFINFSEVTPPFVVEVARRLNAGGIDAAACLTLPSGKLSAWSAHVTRGSYLEDHPFLQQP